jgi:PhnB protein
MTNRFSPIPEGFHTVTPYLMVPDADALVEFMTHAFGVEEVFRTRGARGGLHVEVRVGDSMVMIGGLQGGEPQPATIFVYMDGVDEVYRRALEAGASSIEEPANRPSDAERRAAFTDPFGNAWFVAVRIEDVSRQELQKRRDDLA